MCSRFTVAKDLAEFVKFFNFVCRVAFFARGWLLRARSVGLTAFAEAKSFSPLPKLLKSSSAPASEMLPGLPTGKQRPKRFARMYKSKLENLRIKKLEVIRFIQEPFQLHANAA